jgi:hypothetical protein
MAENWVRTFENGLDYLESLDGVLWADAPLPYPWHHCQPQTRGLIGLNYTERCACGAIRMSARGPWVEKNQTRRHRAKARRDARAPKETVTCDQCGASYEAVAASPMARERLCTSCWGERFVAEYR